MFDLGSSELFALFTEFGDRALDPALKTEAREAETTHGPVSFVSPGEKWVHNGCGRINTLWVQLGVGEDARPWEAAAVELAWPQRYPYHHACGI